MFDRLRITTRDVLRTYNKIARSIFCKTNLKLSFKDETFKATTLEKKIQDLIATKELEKYILRKNNKVDFAKTFVCAISTINIAHLRLSRLYNIRQNTNTNCKI